MFARFFAVSAVLTVLGAVSAQAADLPVKAHPMAPAPYPWTGFYLGGSLGGAWADGTSDITQGGATGNVTMKSGGVLGGIQAGYNWQVDRVILGIEADFEATSLTSSANGVMFGNPYSATAKIPYFATVRGRIGTLVNGWMPYITGGGVIGYFHGDGTVPTGNFGSTAWGGWTVGAGVEVPWMDRWTWKVEYLYIDTGHHSDSFNGGATLASSRVTMNVVRLGLNYHF